MAFDRHPMRVDLRSAYVYLAFFLEDLGAIVNGAARREKEVGDRG